MEINRKYITFILITYGLYKSIVALLSTYSYTSGKVSYLLNETIIFGVLGVFLVIGAMNLNQTWGKALTALFFTFIAVKQFGMLLAGLNIQWLAILIEGREIIGSSYWYIHIFPIAVYTTISAALYTMKDKNA